MSTAALLGDMNQSTVYIPYQPDAERSNPSVALENDLPDGPQLRLVAYKKAWSKCLDRVQGIIRELHSPVAAEISVAIQNAHSGVLPGLPYPEIPVISVTAPSTGPSFLQNVTEQLGQDDEVRTFVTQMHPGECSSVITAMKTLIGGLVQQSLEEDDEGLVKRKATTSLATFDIQLLVSWFSNLRKATNIPISLVVIMHEFEQWNPLVVQDILYICSLQVSKLPLVFLLSLSSPPSPSFLRITYPRATLGLLRVQSFTVPSGPVVLESVLERTFFDVDFEPSVVLGPATLDFLCQHFARQNTGMDSVMTILQASSRLVTCKRISPFLPTQLAYMKHFEQPLTAFTNDSFLGTRSTSRAVKKLTNPNSLGLLDALSSRVFDVEEGELEPEKMAAQWKAATPEQLLDEVDSAREDFVMHARRMRIAFTVLTVVQEELAQYRVKHTNTSRTRIDMMREAVRGQLGENTYLISVIKQVSMYMSTLIVSLIRFAGPLIHRCCLLVLEGVQEFLDNVAIDEDEEEDEALAKAKGDVGKLILSLEDDKSHVPTAEKSSIWLARFLAESLGTPLHELDMGDIWSTGLTPFPSELINPSVRASILSGLRHPHDYSDFLLNLETGPRALSYLPDTSILFRRYLDSGKMINVYDWFDAFLVVLESQRRRARKLEPLLQKRSKGTANAKQAENEEENEEEWQLHIQARFMRALHELDHLGLIKHTSRKQDHVLRTVFDQPD